jgi:hypothetical protein
MWCHLPLALPVLGLVLFTLPLPIAAPLYGVGVLASVLMYRILLRALRLPVETGLPRNLRADRTGGCALMMARFLLWRKPLSKS